MARLRRAAPLGLCTAARADRACGSPRGQARAGARRTRLRRRRRLDGDPHVRAGCVPRNARRPGARRPLRNGGGVGDARRCVPHGAHRRDQTRAARLHRRDRGCPARPRTGRGRRRRHDGRRRRAGGRLPAGWLAGGRGAPRVGCGGALRGARRVVAVMRVSEEVRVALASGDAVVALETTLVAHGFPPGEGLDVGLESERQVRAAGAVPATVGVLDGEIVVGLTEGELERFAADARKVGPRDLATAVVQRAVGATTVGGTLAVARAAGISWMATGGLGRVHRGFPHPPHVSAGLAQLARTAALVVSAGVKSLLDVPSTAELLESLGVPVLGFRVDTLPLFYAAAGGPPVSARVDSAAEAAQIARAHWQLAGGGLLLRRPPAQAPVAGLTATIQAITTAPALESAGTDARTIR